MRISVVGSAVSEYRCRPFIATIQIYMLILVPFIATVGVR